MPTYVKISIEPGIRELFLKYSIITWCFSYWPSYRSEACCYWLEAQPKANTSDRGPIIRPIWKTSRNDTFINQSNISRDFSLQLSKRLEDSDLAVIGLTGIGPIRKISVLDWFLSYWPSGSFYIALTDLII
jgi:hypothetical protein